MIVYVPKSSGKKYPPATTPPMNSAAAASFNEAEKDARNYDGLGSHG